MWLQKVPRKRMREGSFTLDAKVAETILQPKRLKSTGNSIELPRETSPSIRTESLKAFLNENHLIPVFSD
jgi:hypothetical protein